MHDSVEQRLKEWRTATVKLLPGQEETVLELEGHLRDQIEALLQSGLKPDEACSRAIERLGDPHAMAAEFGRLQARRLPNWWPARLAICGLALLMIPLFGLLSWKYLSGSASLLLLIHVFACTVGYTAMFASGGMGICYLCTHFFRRLTHRERRAWRWSIFVLTSVGASAVLVALILGGVWAMENMGRFWGWDPKETGGMLVLLWTGVLAMAQACATKGLPERVVPMMAVLGSAITAFAWFGGNALATGAPISPFLILFVAGHVVVAMIGLPPAGAGARIAARS